jgi:hypothetical protein
LQQKWWSVLKKNKVEGIILNKIYFKGNLGCGGGYPTEAIKYVINTGGIDTEAAYPYQAVVSQFINLKILTNFQLLEGPKVSI